MLAAIFNCIQDDMPPFDTRSHTILERLSSLQNLLHQFFGDKRFHKPRKGHPATSYSLI